MNFSKKIVALLFAAVLLLSSCSGGDPAWAFKSGQFQVTPGLYILYEISALGEAEEKIAENDPNYAGMKSSDLLKQTVEDKLVSDWVKARAVELVKEHLAVQEKFTGSGLALSDADLASIESSLGSAKSNAGDFYEKNGISEATLREFYTGVARKSRLFTSLYSEGGELAASDSELKQHFSSNYSLLDTLLIPKSTSVPEGETKTLEELIAAEKAGAEGYLARLKAGEEIEQLDYEWSLSKATEENRADITKPEKGALNTIISESMRASYGDAIVDSAFTVNVGDSAMIEDNTFFWVFKRLDILESSTMFDVYKPSILQELKKDEYQEVIDAYASAIPLETNTSVVNRYTPEKIKEN